MSKSIIVSIILILITNILSSFCVYFYLEEAISENKKEIFNKLTKIEVNRDYREMNMKEPFSMDDGFENIPKRLLKMKPQWD